jgi:quercetin dioxygenase-like cupin family protein
MVMHVERRNSCNQDGTPKHFHPAAGTLVYVLDGTSQSKSSGDWQNYSKNEYWFERSDWVHGGEADIPSLPEGTCQQLLVVRVAEEGKDHTVFID